MSDNNMLQIAYLSFATRELKVNADQEIGKILDTAVANNARLGVTGQLIYRGGIFLQLLEGEKNKVEHLLGCILLDRRRHEGLKILLKQPMIERVFPEWSMAYKKLDNVALDLVNSIVPWQSLITSSAKSGAIKPNRILNVFEELRS